MSGRPRAGELDAHFARASSSMTTKAACSRIGNGGSRSSRPKSRTASTAITTRARTTPMRISSARSWAAKSSLRSPGKARLRALGTNFLRRIRRPAPQTRFGEGDWGLEGEVSDRHSCSRRAPDPDLTTVTEGRIPRGYGRFFRLSDTSAEVLYPASLSGDADRGSIRRIQAVKSLCQDS